MNTEVTSIIRLISSQVIGKEQQVKLALTCLLAKGHLLIEDLPGMGKTTLAHTLAKVMNLNYQRCQFTSDMLPADIIGVSIFDKTSQSFHLHQGPLFNQVILADEINRASPKTQSALLEAMESSKVSIDGETHFLPVPFFVIATQNPQYHIGTYPLPESQLDRFMMKISLGFPDVSAERKILSAITPDKSLNKEQARPDENITDFSTEQLIAMQEQVEQIEVSDAIVDYVIALCRVSRQQQALPSSTRINFEQLNPLSPRAAKALLAAGKAWAFIHGRDFVLPDDIQAVFYSVCQHRLTPPVNNEQSWPFDETEQSKHLSVSEQIISSVDVVNPLVTPA